ncbi:MAG: aldo/keto reductase [Steroidobacteraceae bacterium]
MNHSSTSPRSLGRTGRALSPIGFGCMGLVGWYGTRNDAESRVALAEAIESGVNHFDTAASYQLGESERFVGEVLRPHRARVLIATKCGLSRTPTGAAIADNRPETIRSSCDASLGRLGIEVIDLFYLHRIDPTVPIEDSVGALRELVTAGKVRAIGLSESSVATLRRAHAVHPVSAVQTEYSIWSRDPEQGMLAACAELGTTFVAYSPLGRGFLAGNFRRLSDLPENDNRRNQPRFQDDAAARNESLVELLRSVAAEFGATPAQLAIAWVLARSPQIVTIPGMKTREHLRDNLAALRLELPAELLRNIDARADALTVVGDRHPPAMMKIVDREP